MGYTVLFEARSSSSKAGNTRVTYYAVGITNSIMEVPNSDKYSKTRVQQFKRLFSIKREKYYIYLQICYLEG